MKIIARFIDCQKGMMLLTLLLLLPMLWWLWILTMDGTNTDYAANLAKTSLNRAVKGAVLAVDGDRLAEGRVAIDSVTAYDNFILLLRNNLFLDDELKPSLNSPLWERPEKLDFFVCNEGEYPFTYRSLLGISFTFHDPGVFALYKFKHKAYFSGRIHEIYVSAAAEVRR